MHCINMESEVYYDDFDHIYEVDEYVMAPEELDGEFCTQE